VYHRVHPKWFLSQWFIWCKPCTSLPTILALSPNGLKQDSAWPTSPRSSIECVQNDFWAYGTFGANRATILPQDYHYLQIDWIELPLEPRHLGVPWVRPKWFVSLWYVWRNLCTYRAPTLILSPNGPKWYSIWPTSPRSSIGCVQNDFWACGTFGANCASILH
jgi:hypothetical protein